jgi:hypothetical protein
MTSIVMDGYFRERRDSREQSVSSKTEDFQHTISLIWEYSDCAGQEFKATASNSEPGHGGSAEGFQLTIHNVISEYANRT